VQRAIEAFQQALQRGPEIEEVHCNLTHCYALAGDLGRAERHARAAQALDPHCPHVHRHLALAYLLAGQPERSLAAWERVRVLVVEHPELPVGIGRAYAQLDRRSDARRSFLKALQGPFAADTHYGLGDLARAAGEYEEAQAHYADALTADADFPEARRRQAECLGELGRYEQAWGVIAPLLAGEQRDPEAVAAAARILHGCGRHRLALRMLRELVGIRSGEGLRWCLLGRHLLEVGRPRAALPALERALRREPGDVQAARALARALGRLGARRKAVRLLAQAAHRSPGEAELHLDVAAAQLASRRPAAAERALLRGLSWNPEAASLWAAAAELALEDGRLDLARARLRSALRRNRREPHALALLVRWLERRGRPLQAVHAARAAARVLPADDEIQRDYGRALLRAGRSQDALLVLRRYVLAAPHDPRGYEALARTFDVLGDPSGARTQRTLRDLVPMSARG